MTLAVISNFAENKILNMLLGTASTAPTDLWLAYGTAADDTGVTEPGGGGYARVALGLTAFNAASGGASALASAVDGDPASGSQGTITHVGFYDAATSGNLLFWGELTTARVITSGVRFELSTCTITLDGSWVAGQANNVLDHLLRGAAWTTATPYFGLLDVSNVELTGSGYARVATTGLWNTVSGGATDNSGAVTFAAASGAWSEATQGAIYGTSSGGTAFMKANLTSPITVASTQSANFPVGAIDLSLT